MSAISVVGARGFVGSHLVRELHARGHEVHILERTETAGGSLGTLVYCAGVTADSRTFPYRAFRAHAVDLMPLLEKGKFERLVYLSSTRVYGLAPARTNEDAALAVQPGDPEHLYSASKIMGESLIATSGLPAHVLRLSNVVGVDHAGGNFLAQVLLEAMGTGRVTLRTALASEKDYVEIKCVVRAILAVIEGQARQAVYNVAAGMNTRHSAIVEALAALTGAKVDVVPNAPLVAYPKIDVERLRGDLAWNPTPVLEQLPELVAAYRTARRA
jgi:nucleoside-diphosphate-sugar epimerase